MSIKMIYNLSERQSKNVLDEFDDYFELIQHINNIAYDILTNWYTHYINNNTLGYLIMDN